MLLLDEPTRGIDLAAKAEIYALLRKLAAEGFGIVLCSSEMSEILTQCHRVVVFREGPRRGRALARRGDRGTRPRGGGRDGDARADRRLSRTQAAAARPRARRSRAPPARAADERSSASRPCSLLSIRVFSPVRGGRPVFLDIGNLTDILRQVAEKGILAVGMTAVIISGGIDLSVGSVLALAATLTAWLLMKAGVGLGRGGRSSCSRSARLCGAINGFVVARWRLQPFIATLATMSAARGVARYLSGGTAIPLGFGAGGAPESMRAIAGRSVPFVPVPAVIFAADGRRDARLPHADARRPLPLRDRRQRDGGAALRRPRRAGTRPRVYVIAAGLAALAGIVHCAQLEQGNPNDGVAYELDAIAAVVIGGTSLSGGIGTVGGTLVGVLIIGVINNIMGLNNVDANLQLILKGVIILGAVWLQRRRASADDAGGSPRRRAARGGLAVALGCGRAQSGKHLIGFSQCNLGEPWRVAMNAEVAARAKDFPDIEIAYADAQQDNAKQVADVENFLRQKIDLLIISPNEAKPLTPIVRKASSSRASRSSCSTARSRATPTRSSSAPTTARSARRPASTSPSS